jgi:hypothetical protein
VTDPLLAEARRRIQAPPGLADLEQALLTRCGQGRVALWQVVELAAEPEPRPLASERLALAERAVWELLHHGAVILIRGDQPLHRDQWQPALLSWQAWRGGEPGAVVVERAAA